MDGLVNFLRDVREHFSSTPHEPDVWERHPARCFMCGFDLTHDIHDI